MSVDDVKLIRNESEWMLIVTGSGDPDGIEDLELAAPRGMEVNWTQYSPMTNGGIAPDSFYSSATALLAWESSLVGDSNIPRAVVAMDGYCGQGPALVNDLRRIKNALNQAELPGGRRSNAIEGGSRGWRIEEGYRLYMNQPSGIQGGPWTFQCGGTFHTARPISKRGINHSMGANNWIRGQQVVWDDYVIESVIGAEPGDSGSSPQIIDELLEFEDTLQRSGDADIEIIRIEALGLGGHTMAFTLFGEDPVDDQYFAAVVPVSITRPCFHAWDFSDSSLYVGTASEGELNVQVSSWETGPNTIFDMHLRVKCRLVRHGRRVVTRRQ